MHKRGGLAIASLGVVAAWFGPLLWLSAPPVIAGTQTEESLADSVRLALSNEVSHLDPPTPQFLNNSAASTYHQWLDQMSHRLKRKTRDRLDWQTSRELLQTVWYEAKRAGLEASLVLGLIQVESAFRKHAISKAGAMGYMQVMPFWAKLIGDGRVGRLFELKVNLRFGCVILRHYLQLENYNFFMALGRYNGSRGRAEYPRAVLAASREWE